MLVNEQFEIDGQSARLTATVDGEDISVEMALTPHLLDFANYHGEEAVQEALRTLLRDELKQRCRPAAEVFSPREMTSKPGVWHGAVRFTLPDGYLGSAMLEYDTRVGEVRVADASHEVPAVARNHFRYMVHRAMRATSQA